MNRIFRLIYPLSLLLTMSSCSLLGSWNETLTITSEPDLARVEINGTYIGETPLKHSIRRNRDFTIKLSKEGHQTVFLEAVKSVPSALGILDIIGGSILLLPFLGFISPAAWRYEQSAFGVSLPPVTGEIAKE